ncbi:hypothetical protein DPMN_008679 [Dreissena polymorpha]|uniref:Uncharacterized protein n=1 Tax=Dreissena polymorpha TaxID=45954 RepID=A0A9D4MYJ5_DREPO|nr:hypothetical protein DPMN_008679 [Dreissena polymorpha]
MPMNVGIQCLNADHWNGTTIHRGKENLLKEVNMLKIVTNLCLTDSKPCCGFVFG